MHRQSLKTLLAVILGLALIMIEPQVQLTQTIQNHIHSARCSHDDAKMSLGSFFKWSARGEDKWGGPNTVDGNTHLTYYIWNRDLGELTKAQWDAEIKASFEAWATVTNLSFEQLSSPRGADIYIAASNRKRDEFGEAGGVLAWAFLPDKPEFDGQLWSLFDIAEYWSAGNPTGDEILLRAVATHEIGHLLGLDHSEETDALMYPYYNPSVYTPQDNDDIPRIQDLYRVPQV